MLQDNLRSAVYKSLTKPLPFGCENGDSSVEFGTNTKSKTCHSLEMNSTEGSGRRCFNLIPTAGEREEKAMEFRRKSELQQLHEVSRGAHELTRMISSWSKAPNLDRRSKHIAKDLLRGSLDLQESLEMLAKLQDASKRIAHLKMKQRSNGEIGVVAMSGSKRSEMSAAYSDNDSLQEPRCSVDGPSRDSIQELRVIRDSLYRQSLLPACDDDEKTWSMQSFRSSGSSRFEDLRCEPDENAASSVSATPQPKKTRAPNLVAKLMGLEEVAFETVQPSRKEEDWKKSSKLPRPAFDIEMLKARKLQLVEQTSDPKQKTLEQIFEAMQFQGLIRSNLGEDATNKYLVKNATNKYLVENVTHKFCYSNALPFEQHDRDFSNEDEAPPIVIMKPWTLHPLERAEEQKEIIIDKISVQEEKQPVKLIHEGKVLENRKVLHRTSTKQEMKEKLMEKARVELSQQKVNVVATVTQKQHKKDATKMQKNPKDGQKPPLSGKRPEGKKELEIKRSLIPTPKKTCPAAPAKPNVRSFTQKNAVPSVKPVSKNPSNSAKEKKAPRVKPIRKSTVIKETINDKKSEEGNANSYLCQADAILPTSSTLYADDLAKQTEQESKSCSNDDTSADKKLFSEVMPKTCQVEKSHGIAAEVLQVADNKSTIKKASDAHNDVKHQLLSNQLFLSHAEELFGIDVNQPMYYQRTDVEGDVMRNAKLILDCGKELMAWKSHWHELLIHPMLQNRMLGRIISFSLEQLVEEISSRIKQLTNYSREDDTSEDGLYSRLERDLRCKEIPVNTMWDAGWMNSICTEEADQLVGEVEDNILSWLMEEVTMDLVG